MEKCLRFRSWRNLVWLLFGFIAVFAMCVHIKPFYMFEMTDVAYHVNRVYQMLSCIKNDMSLWFYNNDLNGMGYASSFFYGWITLVPFLPVYEFFDAENFVFVYHLFSGLVLFIGLYMFASRYTNKAGILSVLFIIQPIGFFYYYMSSLMPCLLGTGLCFIFFSYCIDYFRSGRNCGKACFVWFLIVNTHLISMILGFIGCVIIFLFYFDRARVMDYITFCIYCCIVSLWNVIQILYYIHIYLDGENARLALSGGFIYGKTLTLYSMFDIFGVLSGSYIVIYNFIIQFAILFNLFRKKTKTKREKFALYLCVVGVVISVYPVFMFINERINLIIQFPSRLYAFIFFILMLISFRDMRSDILRLFAVFSGVIFLLYFLVDVDGDAVYPYEYHINEDVYRTSWELQPYMALFGYIGTGEYLPSCSRVLWGSEIIEPDSGYNFRTGVTSVDLSENTQDFVEVHRLYYNGYKSNAGQCYQTDNGYVGVDVSGFSGILKVWYEYPLILRLSFILEFIVIGFIILRNVFRILFKVQVLY